MLFSYILNETLSYLVQNIFILLYKLFQSYPSCHLVPHKRIFIDCVKFIISLSFAI